MSSLGLVLTDVIFAPFFLVNELIDYIIKHPGKSQKINYTAINIIMYHLIYQKLDKN